jgi:hypothetical protein
LKKCQGTHKKDEKGLDGTHCLPLILSQKVFPPFCETLAFFSGFCQRQECHLYNFFFLFYFIDIRLSDIPVRAGRERLQ